MPSLASVANALHAQSNNAISAGVRARTSGELALEIVAGILTGGIAVLALEAYKYYSSQKNSSDFTKIAPEIFNKLDSTDSQIGDKSVSIKIGKDVEIKISQLGGNVVLTCGKEQVTLHNTNFEAIKRKIAADILGNPRIYGDVSRDFLDGLNDRLETALQIKLNKCAGNIEKSRSERYTLDFHSARGVFVEQTESGSKNSHPQKVRVALRTMVPDRMEKYKFEPGDFRKNILPLLVDQNFRSTVGMSIKNTLLEKNPAVEKAFSDMAFNEKEDQIFRISDSFETDRTIYVESRFANGTASFNSLVAIKFTEKFFEEIKSGTYVDSRSIGIESLKCQGFAASSDLYNPIAL